MTKARSNATAKAAKGDLTVGSGTNLSDVLAVGNNGETIVADSSTSTGLRYQGSMAAGRNFIVNGGLDVWQRGTSFSQAASTGTTYTADRWCNQTGASQATTISRQATNDTTNLPFIQYCLRLQRNSGQTGTQGYSLIQPMESVNAIPLAGKTVTFSFYARAGANYSATGNAFTYYVRTGTGTDQNPFNSYTGQAFPIQTTATLTTTWQRFSTTGTIATTATEIAPQFEFIPTGTAGANDYFEVTGIQLEVGSVATQFTRTGGTIQGELAACQRYYYQLEASSLALGNYYSTTLVLTVITLPVTMRIAPTGITNNSATGTIYVAGNARAISAWTWNGGNQRAIELNITSAADTAGRVGSVSLQSGSIGISTEL